MDLFSDTDSVPSGVDFAEGVPKRIQFRSDLNGFDISLLNGELFFAANFLNNKISDRSLEYFLENDRFAKGEVDWPSLSEDSIAEIDFENINWKQDRINLYGKSHLLPRLTAWHGDSSRDYTYSGITSRPNPWNKGLIHIKEKIERVAGARFNSVLLNWYRSGEDHLSWHSDDERELGPNPLIASINFGEPRDFVLRRNDDHDAKIALTLSHGTLLIMRGELQHFWQHSIPKRKRIRGTRINLTFRSILGPE